MGCRLRDIEVDSTRDRKCFYVLEASYVCTLLLSIRLFVGMGERYEVITFRTLPNRP